MREERTHGAFAVEFVVLCHNSDNRHGNSYEAIVVDADPDDVEPGQAAFGCPPRASISSTAFGEPVNWCDPGLNG